MKIYLAAPWADRELMKERASKFQERFHYITWSWWNTPNIGERLGKDAEKMEQAINDRNGVQECDALILFNTSKSEGKAVEQGIAISERKPIIAIGQLGDGTSLNVFHYLPQYRWVDTIEQALDVLEILQWQEDNAI